MRRKSLLILVQSEAAVNFLLNYIPSAYQQPFRVVLLPLVEYVMLNCRDQLRPVWENGNASAHRTLKFMQGKPDKVMGEALDHFQMPSSMFPQDLVIFIEEDNVSFRLQDDQEVQTLWCLTECSKEVKIATVFIMFNW
jgi:hypothetical protein